MVRKSQLISFLLFSIVIINPISVNAIDYSSSFTEIGSIAPESDIINMRIIDNELAFLVEINRGLVIYNITNPRNPLELDHYILSFVHDIELDLERKLVYVTASTGVNIFNFSNPNQLELLSVYLNFSSSTYIQLKEKLLFVGAEGHGLQIVNVTDPNNPIMIGKWIDALGHIGQIYVLENFAFAGIRTLNIGGPPTPIALKLLDISDPSNITYIATVDTGTGYDGGAPKSHDQELVYFNDFSNGLKIMNFSDPLITSVMGTYFDGGSINDVKLVDSDIAFLADDGEGLKIINCSDPLSPTKIGSYNHQWRTIRVAVEDDAVYLATLGGGVRILESGIIKNEISIPPLFIYGISIITCSILLYRAMRRKKLKKI